MSKVSAQARREMEQAMAGLDTATADVRALFSRIEPYTALDNPADFPFPDWTHEHFGLLLFVICRDSPVLLEQVRHMSMQNPAEFMSLIATIFRCGYAAREHEGTP